MIEVCRLDHRRNLEEGPDSRPIFHVRRAKARPWPSYGSQSRFADFPIIQKSYLFAVTLVTARTRAAGPGCHLPNKLTSSVDRFCAAFRPRSSKKSGRHTAERRAFNSAPGLMIAEVRLAAIDAIKANRFCDYSQSRFYDYPGILFICSDLGHSTNSRRRPRMPPAE